MTETTSLNSNPEVQEITKPALVGFAALIDNVRKTGTPAQKTLVASLDTYIMNMSPEQKVSNDQGAKYQYNLWLALANVINNVPADEFKKLWNIVLIYFEEYKNTVFHDKYVFRFSEYWQWSTDQLTALQRIINIIKLTCNVETRANGLKQVDLNRSLDTGITDSGRQKIVNFYNKS